LAIAALALWLLTASAGVSLLRSGRAVRGAAADPAQPADAAAGRAQTDGATGGPAQPEGAPVRYAAVPLTKDGKPPPVPRAKVAAPPGEHPLLQFCHPALALIGFGFWLGFVLVHYRPLAWISFGVLLATVGAGLSWLAANALAARRRQGATRAFPPRLIVLHGLAAAATLALTVLTALLAGHG
jgi:hypothetical protein